MFRGWSGPSGVSTRRWTRAGPTSPCGPWADITAGRRWDLAVAHYTPARGLNRARRTWLVERLRDAVMLNDGDRTAMMAELMPLAREFETSFGRLEDHLPSLVVASVPGSLWQRVTGRPPPDWAADAARALRQPLSGWKPARVALGAQGQDGYRGAGPVVISGDERRWRIWHEPSGRELTSSLLPIRHLATACAEAEAWAQGMNWQAADVDRQITNLRLRLAAARAEGSREAYHAVLREGQPALSLGPSRDHQDRGGQHIALRGPLARATPAAAQSTAPQWQPVRFEPAYRIAGSKPLRHRAGNPDNLRLSRCCYTAVQRPKGPNE